MKLFGAKKEIKKTDKAGRASREAFEALNHLKEDMQKKPIGDISEKFFNIVKRFFSDYFSLKYEFTHDEFSRDIKRKRSLEDNVKGQIISFSQYLSDMKYKYGELSNEQIKKAIQDFSKLVLFLSDKKKHEALHEQTRRLTEYVEFALKKGKTKAEIHEALLSAGWPSSVVRRELEKLQ